ncbi:MAG TPA: hypothetical protein VF163_17880 [Micromonosporaceae bacterium]
MVGVLLGGGEPALDEAAELGPRRLRGVDTMSRSVDQSIPAARPSTTTVQHRWRPPLRTVSACTRRRAVALPGCRRGADQRRGERGGVCVSRIGRGFLWEPLR